MNQAQLQQHDRIKKSTEMPLFYGSKDKDVCSALYLVDRLENSAEIAGWDTDKKKCEEFYAVLRDKALIWWYNLKDHNVNNKDWKQVKAAFLKVYEPKYSPKLTCTNFAELNQRNNESAHDFYLRISDLCRKMFHGRPAALFDIRADYPRAGAGAYDEATVKAIKKEGLEDDEMYIKHQFFIAGLKEELRTKVIEANKGTLGESVYYATELEQTLNEKKLRSNLAPITEVELDDLNEEEKNMINALRGKKFGGKFQKRGPPKANSSTICRYCKKTGHFQKECRSRIRDKAPMVDANGQPFRRVHPVTEGSTDSNDAEWKEEPQVVGSISGGAASLNWF